MKKIWGLALLPLAVHFVASADDLVAPALKNSIADGKASQQRVEKAADAAVAPILDRRTRESGARGECRGGVLVQPRSAGRG